MHWPIAENPTRGAGRTAVVVVSLNWRIGEIEKDLKKITMDGIRILNSQLKLEMCFCFRIQLIYYIFQFPSHYNYFFDIFSFIITKNIHIQNPYTGVYRHQENENLALILGSQIFSSHY